MISLFKFSLMFIELTVSVKCCGRYERNIKRNFIRMIISKNIDNFREEKKL